MQLLIPASSPLSKYQTQSIESALERTNRYWYFSEKRLCGGVKVDRAIILGQFSFDERNKIHSHAPLLRAMVQAF